MKECRFAGHMGTIQEVQLDAVTVTIDGKEGGVERFSTDDVAEGVLVPQAAHIKDSTKADFQKDMSSNDVFSESVTSQEAPRQISSPSSTSSEYEFEEPPALDPENTEQDREAAAAVQSMDEFAQHEEQVARCVDEEDPGGLDSATLKLLCESINQAPCSAAKNETVQVDNVVGNHFFGVLDARLTYLMQKKAACDEVCGKLSPRQRRRSPQPKAPECGKSKLSLAELAAQLGEEPQTFATNARNTRRRASCSQAKQRQQKHQGQSDEELLAAVRAVTDVQMPAEAGYAVDEAFSREWREKLVVELGSGVGDLSDSFKRARDEACKLQFEGALYGTAMPGRSKMRFRLDLNAHLQGTVQPRLKKEISMEPVQTALPQRAKLSDGMKKTSEQAGKVTGFWNRRGPLRILEEAWRK